MNKPTVMIAFRSEGRNEVERTIEGIKRMAGEVAEILSINDASENGYDNRELKRRFPCVEFAKMKRLFDINKASVDEL